MVLPSRGPQDVLPSGPDLGYAHEIASYFAKTSDLTVIVTSEVDVEKYEDYFKRDLGQSAKIISLTKANRLRSRIRDLRVIDHIPFIDRSMQVFEYVTQSHFDCIIFDVFDAAGFVSIRAKKTGLGLDKTLLVSWLRICHGLERNHVLGAPQFKSNLVFTQELDFAEQYCCENCDMILAHTDTILKWVFDQRWNLNRKRILRLSDVKAGRPLWPVPVELEALEVSDQQQAGATQASPLVSVCVAHFNDGRNLRYLLKSIIKNDYQNYEVIVVDDGSTDTESLRIIQSLALEYAADSWRFIMKKENESIGPTRNFAVSHARGELIIFMDSDNLATKTMVSDFVTGMLTSRADCLTCGMIEFEGENGEPDDACMIGQWIPLGPCLERGFFENVFGDANFCVKKSVFTDLGGFCGIRGHVADDWEFLARLVLAGFHLDVIPKLLFYYRVKPGTWLRSAWSKHSIQTLRRRFLIHTGPQHESLLHNLLLHVTAENERLMSTAWNLDRKIVKFAIQLADIVSEKNRLLIQEISIPIFKKLHETVSAASQFAKEIVKLFLSRFHTNGSEKANTCAGVSGVRPFIARGPICFSETLSDSQRVERLTKWELPSDRTIFGFLGDLERQNRPLGFLKLAYWMQMFQNDSFFVIIGNGALANEVKVTAARYGLTNFKWISAVENTQEFYPILSGIVITSASDQLGAVAMFEALAHGIPVFSTDVGKAKYVLEQYGSGLAVGHDPEGKDFAECFKLWKDNLEIYKTAAMEAADLLGRRTMT